MGEFAPWDTQHPSCPSGTGTGRAGEPLLSVSCPARGPRDAVSRAAARPRRERTRRPQGRGGSPAAREQPWPQVCLVLPARGVQRILKYVSVFFKSRDSTHARTHTRMYVCVCMYIWCAFCNIRRRDNIWSVVLGGACSPHFSTDHTLPYGLYWSLLAIGAVFWAPSDE